MMGGGPPIHNGSLGFLAPKTGVDLQPPSSPVSRRPTPPPPRRDGVSQVRATDAPKAGAGASSMFIWLSLKMGGFPIPISCPLKASHKVP